MFRLPRSLLALSLTSLFTTQVNSQNPIYVYWNFPTTEDLFGIQINYNDVIIASWSSNVSSPYLYVWGPWYNGSETTLYAWYTQAVDSSSSFAVRFSDAPQIASNYTGSFPFLAHMEITGSTNLSIRNGVNSDPFTITSSNASPRTYAVSYTLTAASSTTSSSSTTSQTESGSVSASSSPTTLSATSSASVPPASTATPTSPAGSGISAGAIAGIVVGALAGLAILVGLAVFLFLRNKRKSKQAQEKDEMPIWPNGRGELEAGAGSVLSELPGEERRIELDTPGMAHELPPVDLRSPGG